MSRMAYIIKLYFFSMGIFNALIAYNSIINNYTYWVVLLSVLCSFACFNAFFFICLGEK